MKKILITVFILAFASTSYAGAHKCYRYVNGKATTYTMIEANSKSEAERKAYKQFKKSGGPVDYVKCN